MPPTTASFATDVEVDYHEPAAVGDRLTVKGRKLISCLGNNVLGAHRAYAPRIIWR